MKNLHILLLFLLPISISAQEGYLEDIKKKWKNAGEYTIALAELMPADSFDFKPVPEQMSFKEQILHVVQNMTWLSKDYLDAPAFDKDLKSKTYTKAETIAILKEGFAYATKAINTVEIQDLRIKVDFFAGPMNVRQILTLMNDHVTHHRGQLIVYLRLNGIKPPAYKGW